MPPSLAPPPDPMREVDFSDERLRLATEAGGIGLYDCDLVTERIAWDERMRGFWGFTANEKLTTELIMSAVHPDDREATMEASERAFSGESGGRFTAEYRVFHRVDGRMRWIAATGQVYFEDGRAVRFLGTAQDVSERKQIEAQFEEYASRSRVIFEQMTDGLIVCDRNGEFLSANPAALEMHGAASVEEMPQTVDAITNHFDVFDLHGRALPPEEWPISRALRGETFHAYEICVRTRRTGNDWIGSYGGAAFRGDDGEIAMAIVTIRDVTSQRAAEHALREADRRKNVFLATLAHELRNPLAPISSAVAGLRSQGVGAELLPALDMIDRQMQQLTRLVDDLLDLSRISRGKIELRRRTVALAMVLQQALESSRPQIDAAAHDVSLSLPADAIHVDVDPLRLGQVFLNLLNNAAKFTPRGGRIRIAVERDGDEAVVRVADNGIGIDPEHITRLFEIFVQHSTLPDRAHDGLGIGLSLAKLLVEMHGGRITAHSEGPGRGSEFVVRLPIVEAAADAFRSASRDRPMRSRQPRKILVVDDKHDAAAALAMFLRAAGNDVTVAQDGQQAIELAETCRPEIVFLDIGMPGMDGYETCRRMRQQVWGQSLTIFAFTGWGQSEDQRRTREAGFDRHLVKPVAPAALLDLLDDLDVIDAVQD